MSEKELDKSSEAPAEPILSPEEMQTKVTEYIDSIRTVTEGTFTNEDVSNIIEAIYKRVNVVLNYSGMSKHPDFESTKVKLKEIFNDEKERYKYE